MRIFNALYFVVLSIGMIWAQSPGDLVITEFMANPSAVSDGHGEYVEFYNNTASPIDINGFILKDDDFDSLTIDNGGPLMVPGFGFIVLGNDSDMTTNGGYHADYQYSGMFLSNSADEIVLATAGNLEICRINYTNGDPFGSGVSAELNNVNNHVGGVTQEGSYVAATTQFGAGDFGSPGSAGNTQGTGGVNPPPTIDNVSRTPRIPDANQSTTVTAKVTDDTNVSLVELRYMINDGAMQSVAMVNTAGDTFTADIPDADYNDGDRVEYWVYAEDNLSQPSESSHFKFFAGDTPISAVKALDANGVLLYDGYDARLMGVSTVDNGTFSTSILDVYMQESGTGINVFSFDVNASFNMPKGNSYTVTGRLDQFRGKTEIIPGDSTDIIDNGPAVLPDPVVLTIAQFLASPETYEGVLISIANVTNTGGGNPWPSPGSNANVEITDDGGVSLLTLRIDRDTDIDENPEPSWPVTVVGIGNQFDSSSPFDGGYQIQPRSYADFIGGLTTFNMSIIADWNLLGLPLNVTDNFYLSVFPNAIPGTLFGWNGSYGNEDSLLFGKGYWLRFTAAETVPITGTAVNSNSLNLIQDWNMISGLSGAVAFADIDDPGGIIIPGTLFGFNGSYFNSDTLFPGNGYWVRTTAAGQINLGTTKSANSVAPFNKLLNTTQYPELKITNPEGAAQTLYFNVDITEPGEKLSFSLPPLPPAGAFDARFAGDYRVSESDDAMIQIQSTAYPLTISASNLQAGNGNAYALIELINGKEGEIHPLSDGGKIEIDNPRVNALKLSKIKNIPVTFAVEQNYPNPFNPSTTIKYALPNSAKVEIQVYNTIGQKVKTLLSENQEAGFYKIAWDATNDAGLRVGSGIYFYTVKAGEYSAVKKMILMK
ncbi:MAG: lamin tail domain-containing protein [Calditrichia bacterium]